MSILKAIMHHYNAATKNYDTLHPETEVAQITDFNKSVDGKISGHNKEESAHKDLFNGKLNTTGGILSGQLTIKDNTLQLWRTGDSTGEKKAFQFDPMNIYGSDGNRYGFIRVQKSADGTRSLQIISVANDNSPSGGVTINTDDSGITTKITGVTPPNNATNKELTTAAWVNNKLDSYESKGSLANDIITKLALTTTISAISALQTGSWFGQLLKLVLNASGVKYLLANNGYICFGSFFGGAIIQWGYASTIKDTKYRTAKFPIAFTNKPFCCTATFARYNYDTGNGGISWNDQDTTKDTVQFMVNAKQSQASPKYMAIGF